ncbi:hypothetical protein ACFYXM_06915 [Streptomyces sp. NPDC002476]
MSETALVRAEIAADCAFREAGSDYAQTNMPKPQPPSGDLRLLV